MKRMVILAVLGILISVPLSAVELGQTSRTAVMPAFRLASMGADGDFILNRLLSRHMEKTVKTIGASGAGFKAMGAVGLACLITGLSMAIFGIIVMISYFARLILGLVVFSIVEVLTLGTASASTSLSAAAYLMMVGFYFIPIGLVLGLVIGLPLTIVGFVLAKKMSESGFIPEARDGKPTIGLRIPLKPAS